MESQIRDDETQCYECHYDPEIDFLEVAFKKSRQILYEYPEGSDQGVVMKRGHEGRVISLGVKEFSKRSEAVNQLLRLFGVDVSAIRPAKLQTAQSAA